jgi:hypothetical protein
MVTWRAPELLRPAIKSLNQGEVIPPAVLARSLVELGSLVLVEANNIHRVGNDMFQKFGVNSNGVAVSEDLEGTIVRLIHGTRLAGHPPDLEQKNVLSYLDLLSRHPDSKWLRGLYDFLCEIAHPNVVGNVRYWPVVESTDEDGSQAVRIERNSIQLSTGVILEKGLWAIGWSSALIRNGLELNSRSTETMRNVFLRHLNSLRIMRKATALFHELQALGPEEFAKWYDSTNGETGLGQGDFEPKISGTGIVFWFKKDANFDELQKVVQEYDLGIVRIGSATHEVMQLD